MDMSKLEESATRLGSALQRLETALDTLFAGSGPEAASMTEVSALLEDRARLANELDASLAREQELQKLADEASGALGAAIAEVRAVLGEDVAGMDTESQSANMSPDEAIEETSNGEN